MLRCACLFCEVTQTIDPATSLIDRTEIEQTVYVSPFDYYGRSRLFGDVLYEQVKYSENIHSKYYFYYKATGTVITNIAESRQHFVTPISHYYSHSFRCSEAWAVPAQCGNWKYPY